MLVLCNIFHRRKSGIVAGLVSTECVSVISLWALTSLDKVHFMVTSAEHVLLKSRMSVLAFLFVFCKPVLLMGFIQKVVEV